MDKEARCRGVKEEVLVSKTRSPTLLHAGHARCRNVGILPARESSFRRSVRAGGSQRALGRVQAPGGFRLQQGLYGGRQDTAFQRDLCRVFIFFDENYNMLYFVLGGGMVVYFIICMVLKPPL